MVPMSIHRSTGIALALVVFVACNHDSNPPPQSPSDITATTGAQATPAPANPTDPGTTPPGQGMPGMSPSTDSSGTAANGMPTSGTASNAMQTSPLAATPGTSAASAGSSGAGSGASAGGDPSALDDGQIVAVVQTADKGEIAQAREALRKAKNGRVKQFAQHMVSDHSTAETKIAALDSKANITPQTNSVADGLKSAGDQIMSNLKSSDGADFDRAYMEAQVSEHTKVLDLLDNTLIPRAQNADLAKTLRDIRAKVSMHLNDAKAIQSELGRSE